MTFTPHPWQTAATEAYFRLGGVFVGLDPGVGKTYAAAAIARRCARPLVVAPASAIPQTMAMFRSYGVPCVTAQSLTAEAPIGAHVVFASYTWLTRAPQADFFERFRPTDVLMDEFHEARGLQNSARKRLERWLIATPETRVGVFTASPMSGSFADIAFGLRWALRGGVNGLVPKLQSGIEMMAERMAASAELRESFRAQFVATPGVFVDAGDAGRYTGTVDIRVVRREPALVLPADWVLPDGFALESPAHAAEVSKQMAWGYWPSVSPRPSAGYLEARRAWSAVVQRVITTGGADTEYQVRTLRPELYEDWVWAQEAEGPLAAPTPVWDVESLGLPWPTTAGTIVWAHHRALQDRAAAELRAPLFREGGRSARGEYLPEYRGAVAVASIEACHQSLNLQHFSRNLVLECPSDPEVWRQLIGRTARQGQRAPRVTVDIVVNCPAQENSLRSALDRATQVQQSIGKSNPILQLVGTSW